MASYSLLLKIANTKTELYLKNSAMEEFLCVSDLCDYLKISKSSVHKLSSTQAIPTYKPGGKLIYFKKSEVNAYLERHRTPSIDEIKTITLNALTNLKH